jgi:hypothetical protein
LARAVRLAVVVKKGLFGGLHLTYHRRLELDSDFGNNSDRVVTAAWHFAPREYQDQFG